RVLREYRVQRCKLRFPHPRVFGLVEPVDDHRQPVASTLTGGIHSREEKLHGLNGLTSNGHSTRQVVERMRSVQVTAVQEYTIGAAVRRRRQLRCEVRLPATRGGNQSDDTGRERFLDLGEQD